MEEAKKPLKRRPTSGRQEIPIDWDFVKNLALAGCNGKQISQDLGMHSQTFYDRCLKDNGMSFTDFTSQFAEKGKNLIRVQQYLKAIGQTKEGDTQLLMFLGKTRCGQHEEVVDPQQSLEEQKASLAAKNIELMNEKLAVELEIKKRELELLKEKSST